MKKGRYKNLFGNMALFTVGNFVSKLLVMLLVPFYTNILTTSEYGIADGMQATLLLLVPLLSLNIGEAALRYGIEKSGSRGNILKILVKYVLISDLMVAAICTVLYFVLGIYAVLFAALFVCNSIYEAVVLYCQGCERVPVMVTGSIVCTILLIASNLYFLLAVRLGLYGYLYSQMISFLGAALIMLFAMKLKGYAENTGTVESFKELEKEMTAYGRGMMLYSTSSWVNNAIDRYFVLYMCGSAANGLYGVAYRIPAILTVFQRIFAQAWQISANKNYDDEDSCEFFTGIYNGYQTIMAIGCSGLIMIVEFVAAFMFAKEFFFAWTMVPMLLISVVFGAMTGFFGSICLAFKDGKSMGYATLTGALVNIALNTVLIFRLGAMGAAIATMISYFVMYIFALRAARRHTQINTRLFRDGATYLLLLVQALVIMTGVSYYIYVEIACFLAVFAIYAGSFVSILKSKHRV